MVNIHYYIHDSYSYGIFYLGQTFREIKLSACESPDCTVFGRLPEYSKVTFADVPMSTAKKEGGKSMEQHEINLYERAAKGDLQAFEIFIARYEKLIYNAAYRMLPNPFDAEDISQDVLIKVYKSLYKCKSPEAFKPWLFKIIHNTCIDEIRKRKNKQTVSIDKSFETEDGAIENQMASDDRTPESEYLKNETAKEVQEAISKLSENFKILIIMRDLNGLSYEEIALSLGISLGTVKSRLSRARTTLKDIYIRMREQK